MKTSPTTNNSVFSALPFANIYWWQEFINAAQPVIDIGENYEKMSFRNKYSIGSANGIFALSIPLEKGRNQRTPMKEVRISYAVDWQKNHWKSLESAYMRTPFFEFYKDYIQHLYQRKYELLADWNNASIDAVLKLLKTPIDYSISSEYIKNPDADFRIMKPKDALVKKPMQTYIQPFEHKFGFAPNLSILDLLFCEGPASLKYLRERG